MRAVIQRNAKGAPSTYRKVLRDRKAKILEPVLQVEEALVRLDRGEYGIRLGCGSPIPTTRLRSIPWARFGVPCQGEGGAAQAAPVDVVAEVN